jgi:hypothetical protein
MKAGWARTNRENLEETATYLLSLLAPEVLASEPNVVETDGIKIPNSRRREFGRDWDNYIRSSQNVWD